MTAAERQRRHRDLVAARTATRIARVPVNLVIKLVRHHGDGRWRGLRWLAVACEAPANDVARVLRDIGERPEEYGIRAEHRLRRGMDEWRLIS